MQNIESYDQFQESVLTKRDKYLLKNPLYFLGNKIVSWIIKAEPFLNEYYQDLKKQTKNLDAYWSAGNRSTVQNLEKVKLDEIKGTGVFKGLYRRINKWNLYRQYYQTDRFVYLFTKDELKNGDMIRSYRRNSWKIDDVVIAVCAKFDGNEFLEDALIEMKDIFSDMELNYDTKIQKIFKNQENSLIHVKFDSRNRLTNGNFDSGFIQNLNDSIKRSINLIKSIGEDWDYILYFWDNDNYLRRHRESSHGWREVSDKIDLSKYKDSEIYLIFYKEGISDRNIENTKPRSSIEHHYVVMEVGEVQNRVQRYDMFFLMSSETHEDLGKSSILIEEVEELYLNSFCKGFRINRNTVSPLFLNYQLLGQVFKELISVEGKGFTRINLRQDRLKDVPVLLPPLPEQEEIVRFLDTKTQEIDQLVSIEEKRSWSIIQITTIYTS